MRKKEISFEEKVFYAFDRMMERLVPCTISLCGALLWIALYCFFNKMMA